MSARRFTPAVVGSAPTTSSSMPEPAANEREPLHFGLWVEMTALMDFLSSDERASLVDALGITPDEYAAVSARYREELQTSADPTRVEIFTSARIDAAAGGREQAIERFNRFLDGLHDR